MHGPRCARQAGCRASPCPTLLLQSRLSTWPPRPSVQTGLAAFGSCTLGCCCPLDHPGATPGDSGHKQQPREAWSAVRWLWPQPGRPFWAGASAAPGARCHPVFLCPKLNLSPHPWTCFRGGGLGSSPGLRGGPQTALGGGPCQSCPACSSPLGNSLWGCRQQEAPARPGGPCGQKPLIASLPSFVPLGHPLQAAPPLGPHRLLLPPTFPHLPNSCSTLSLHPCGKCSLSPQTVQDGHWVVPHSSDVGFETHSTGATGQNLVARQVTAQMNSETKGSQQVSSVSL